MDIQQVQPDAPLGMWIAKLCLRSLSLIFCIALLAVTGTSTPAGTSPGSIYAIYLNISLMIVAAPVGSDSSLKNIAYPQTYTLSRVL
jgi:hypothetical protein